jgi:hypothetical protein
VPDIDAKIGADTTAFQANLDRLALRHDAGNVGRESQVSVDTHRGTRQGSDAALTGIDIESEKEKRSLAGVSQRQATPHRSRGGASPSEQSRSEQSR